LWHLKCLHSSNYRVIPDCFYYIIMKFVFTVAASSNKIYFTHFLCFHCQSEICSRCFFHISWVLTLLLLWSMDELFFNYKVFRFEILIQITDISPLTTIFLIISLIHKHQLTLSWHKVYLICLSSWVKLCWTTLLLAQNLWLMYSLHFILLFLFSMEFYSAPQLFIFKISICF
jgi:hypothetical protein